MEQPEAMNTLSQVLEKLRRKGKDNELVMDQDGVMRSEQLNETFSPEDLTIVKTYRFEGMSDPADNTVIYIVETNNGKIGYIMDAYGTYSDHEGADFDDFLKKIKMADRDEQELFCD